MLDTAVLSSKLEALRKENNIAGLSVSVTDKNGLIFSQGFGVESVERPVLTVGPDTLFKIASISKVINAVTCMGLVDAGLLELDAPVQNYLPWFTLPRRDPEIGIIFGHWAALEGKVGVPGIHALDTGCVWGSQLTLMNVDTGEKRHCACRD